MYFVKSRVKEKRKKQNKFLRFLVIKNFFFAKTENLFCQMN